MPRTWSPAIDFPWYLSRSVSSIPITPYREVPKPFAKGRRKEPWGALINTSRASGGVLIEVRGEVEMAVGFVLRHPNHVVVSQLRRAGLYDTLVVER